jgi:hypothetical protein
VVIINVGHIPGSQALERVVTATLRAVFPIVMRDRVGNANSLVLGSSAPLTIRRMRDASRALPAALHSLAAKVAGRMGPALRGGSVYTDDRAPLEWLTDLSIVQYATGRR